MAGLELQRLMAAILRLGFAVIVFLASLLAVFRPPAYNLWKASILVTEWGHFLALLALFVLLPGWRKTRAGRVAALLGVVAAVCALSPLMRAIPIATDLGDRLASTFGRIPPRSLEGSPPRMVPISLSGLFAKPSSPGVEIATMPFADRAGSQLSLDIYRRAGRPRPAPLVVMIYGGSWRSGAKEDLPELNGYLASRGYVVAAISYRFAPEHRHPAQTEDVNASIDFLKSNSARLRIDSSQIALIGRSAGGQLALLSAYTKNDPAIRGVVAFYPPTDQQWGWENPSDPRVYDSFATLRAFLGGAPKDNPDGYRSSSPLNYVGPRTVPTLLIHGRMDPLVSFRQSARLDSALTALKRPHLFLELPWATHGCDYIFNGPCGQLSTFAIERFLVAVLPGGNSQQRTAGYRPRFFLSYDPGFTEAHFRSVSSSSPRSRE